MIVGEKVKEYLIIRCCACGESFRIPITGIYSNIDKYGNVAVECPWCESDFSVKYDKDDTSMRIQTVKAD